jgi:hypothetical protein
VKARSSIQLVIERARNMKTIRCERLDKSSILRSPRAKVAVHDRIPFRVIHAAPSREQPLGPFNKGPRA